jgi:hypothetical protein
VNTMMKQLLQWPPTSSTVIGAGMMLGLASYWATGSLELAIGVAGVFKMICPQDAPATDQLKGMLDQLGQVMPSGRPRLVAALALTGLALGGLAACSPQQLQQGAAVAGDYQQKIAAACTAAAPLMAAPQVGVYLAAGCAGEQAIAKLALDPSSLDWLDSVMAQAKAAVPAKAAS